MGLGGERDSRGEYRTDSLIKYKGTVDALRNLFFFKLQRNIIEIGNIEL